MKKTLIAGVTLLMVGAGSLFAQSKVGTTVGQFLLIEPSARITGMGNAGVTDYKEIQAAFYNPAAIGHMTGSGGQFTHNLWIADITYDYVAAVMTLGNFGNIYGTVTSLNSGDIDVRTVEQPLGTGERYTVSDLAFGLGYGRQISDRFSLGIQMTYLQETIWHSSMRGFAVSIGTLYQISPEGLRIGASVSNWGTRAKFDGRDLRILYDQNPDLFGGNPALPAELFTNDFPLPILFRVGIGMPFTINENNRLQLAVDAFHPSDNTESVNVGAEWEVFNILALRGGYQSVLPRNREVGLTLGAGVHYRFSDVRFSFDYGWADQGRLQNSHRMTLGITFE